MNRHGLELKAKEYRSIPFWSWNDKLDIEQLKKQIQWMNDNGIGGFFMHARAGLQTEYLSEEWMKCVEACAEEAKQLGMDAWIYDENGWPSGFVGGKLLEDAQNRDKYILAECGGYDSTATVSYLITEDELVRVSSQNEKGEYLNLYIHTAVSTADILNPKVVKQFLELTHEKYKEHFGEEFSKMIKGFFTDEPQYHRANTPYTAMIERYWKKKYHIDILDELGLLFLEKKGYRSFRYRYWKAMQELLLNNFAKTVYNWCEDNHVMLTGHYVEESSMGLQIMCCAGVMPFYEYEHIPGIDWLAKETNSELSSKQVGSVAAQLGKKKVLTETFGCCGWDVSPSELRRIAGFQYVNGVNVMCQHLLPYSERGTRKYDCPAHYSDINPWVAEDFKTFNDYFSRLGCLLGEGKQHVNVAMLHPIRSSYFDYKREFMDDGFNVDKLDDALHRACRVLSSRGIEYHFLDETLLAKYGNVENDLICCGICRYEYLILPTMHTMDRTTEKLIRQYVEQGGKVLLLGGKPRFLEGDDFDYSYLYSNVSLDDIILAQPYSVEEYETQIYSTYRTIEDEAFIYIVNASDSESQKQSFDFGTSVKSFRKLDSTDMTETQVSLEITLTPGEDAVLFLSNEEVSKTKELQCYNLRFEQAEVSVEKNHFIVDKLKFSKDGNSFSELTPCPGMFQQLLREQYEGKIYFKYEFEIESVPEKIYLKTEKSNDISAWLNGKPLTDALISSDTYINLYDIQKYVTCGLNDYTVEVDWYNNEQVYFALFGENVTESLKNCIVYDSELQPIELLGDFGVYSKEDYKANEDERFVNADHFYISEMPKCVTEPSKEGFPFFAGRMILKQNVIFDTTNILLNIPGDYHIAYVNVNGHEAGKMFFSQTMDISDLARVGENEIEVCLVLGNRNLMGPHHRVGNKKGVVLPSSFEYRGQWENGKHKAYHENYDIKKVF